MTATISDQARLILGGDETAFVELRARHPHLRQVKQRWYGLGQLDALERSAATLSQSYDVWLGAARRSERGGTAEHVRSSLCVWADCDSSDAVDALRAFRPVPTLVVRSSSGHLHAWWALDHALERDDIKPALRRLAAALGSDRSVCDRAHVLRAIGTTNHKRAQPERVEAVHFTGERHAIDTVLASTPIDVPSVNGAGTGEAEPRERVAPGGMREHLLDLAVRCVRSGMLDAAAIGRVLCVEFDAVRVPGAAYQDDESDALAIAQWAAGSQIAARERAAKTGGAWVPGATAPRGVGTLAPSPETPMNTSDPAVPTAGTAGTLRRCDVHHMLTTEPEPVDWLIDGVVARGTLTLLAGREKEGKSLLAMGCAARGVSGGGCLAGINVRPLRVAIIDAENGSRELHRRLRSLGLEAKHAERVEIYEAVGHDLRQHLHEIETVLKENKPDLLILDSWRSLWGGDENDSGEVARVLDPLRNLIRKHNAGAMLIHHMRKSGGYRGSSAIGASAENILELARHDEDEDRRRRRLHNPSCRYEQERDDRWLRIEADREVGALLIDVAEPFRPQSPARSEAQANLLAALNGHSTQWGEWARDAGYDPKNGTARRARDQLQQDGKVRTDGQGWMRTEAGA